MRTSCDVMMPDSLNIVKFLIPGIKSIVEEHCRLVAAKARSLAPKKDGMLRIGIIPSPWEEKSRSEGKIGRQVYMDAGMNETFVKTSKNGTRYYYPASQEYGFLRGGVPSGYNPEWYRQDLKNPAYRARALEARRRSKVPGKYFLRTARDLGSASFARDMERLVEREVPK